VAVRLTVIRNNLMFCHQYPTRGVSVWDNVSSSRREGSLSVRNGGDGSHQGGRGLGGCGRVNGCEALRTAVRADQPKVMRGWSQQGTWLGLEGPHSPSAAGVSPAKRRDRPHTGTHVECGTPVARPSGRGRESGPRGPPKGRQGGESGASEGCAVLEQRGIALLSDRRTSAISRRASVPPSAVADLIPSRRAFTPAAPRRHSQAPRGHPRSWHVAAA
jgi:hypothetical protein